MSHLDLDFEKHHSLIPAVLQDADSDAVLMVGFMDRAALEKTLETGRVTFLSRTRERLWTKGETSGNFAVVTAITTDCDRDALLVRVRVLGDGNICHKRTVSCFTESIELPGAGARSDQP
jgi:phosphoribosyl-ATP pyrophosphohydrolase/phosphoribosyl-AMP cyclohydrolase